VATTEIRATLGALGIPQRRIAELFDVSPRCVRRWQRGERHIPYGVILVCRLLAAKTITIAQLEQAIAVSIPTRTNGSAEIARKEHAGRPKKNGGCSHPVSHRQAPPEPVATLADLDTAGKVYALAFDACRWPIGDPQHPGFRFCGCPVVRRPYCERHRTMAYAPSARLKHQAFIFAKKLKAELREEEFA
jgi:hypothetical protein